MKRQGLLALAAIAVLGAVVLLVPARERPAAPFSTDGLARFLESGPSAGTWELCKLSHCQALYVAPHPTDDDALLVGGAGPCADGVPPCAVSRARITRLFFEGRSELFFANYVRRGFPQEDVLKNGTKALRAVWVPRFEPEGLSMRHVWFDEGTGDVIRIQDVSRSGHPVRTIERVALETDDWDPAAFDASSAKQANWSPSCETDVVESAGELDRIVALTPFAILVPAELPRGYELVRATYRECEILPFNAPAAGPQSAAPQPGIPARVATLLYSDGMGLISIAIAPFDEMDAIEAQYGRQMAQVAEDDPQACPGLPAEPQNTRTEPGVVRMRTDKCRTVARRDGVHGVSVMMLARNERSVDDYYRIVMSLRRVEPSAEK